MKVIKSLFILLLLLALAAGGYWYYHREYVETLMLSEIVGKSEQPLENFLTDVFDFDTRLTRHDVKQIRKRKDYWKQRMDEVTEIVDPQKRADELARLYNEMSEDESMKKLRDKIKEKGGDIAGIVLDALQ